LFNDPVTGQYSFLSSSPQCSPCSQFQYHRSEGLPDIFIIPVLSGELCDMESLLLGVSWRTAVEVLSNVE
jgi:hypothetical protein